MKKPIPKIYRTTNYSSYNRALIKRGNIPIWFDAAIQLTTNNISDSQFFGDLLTQIPLDKQIHSVYTDGTDDQSTVDKSF